MPLPSAGAAVAGDLRGAPRGVRRARHPFVPGGASPALDPARKVGVLDDGERAAVRPLPRRAQAPRARRRARSGHGRGRLHPGRLAHARDPLPGRLRGRRRGDRRACRRPASSPRAPRRVVARAIIARAARRRAAGALRRASAPATSSSAHGRVGRVDVDFLSGPKPTGTFDGAVARARRREGGLRLEPPRALVRALTTAAQRTRSEGTRR